MHIETHNSEAYLKCCEPVVRHRPCPPAGPAEAYHAANLRRLFMDVVKIVAGVMLVFLVLWDTFETIIVPRTLMRALRFTRFFTSLPGPCGNGLCNRHHSVGAKRSTLVPMVHYHCCY